MYTKPSAYATVCGWFILSGFYLVSYVTAV